MSQRKTTPRPLRPTDTIIELSRRDCLETLTGAQLVVYIRILGEIGRTGRRVTAKNRELYPRDERTARHAVEKLASLGLVVVHRDRTKKMSREISVPR